MLFAFEIFEIAQDSRKLALCGHPLGHTWGYPGSGCPGVSNVGTQGQPRVSNRSHWSKIIQNLLYLLFAFEIFEIAQDSRKLALCGQPLGNP